MRIFIGINLDLRTKEYLSRVSENIKKSVKGRFVSSENYHITLQFIGDTDSDSLRKIKFAADNASAGIKPFNLSINRLGDFKKGNRHIIWAGTEESDSLKKLYSEIIAQLEIFQISFDSSRFRPHITLVRDALISEDYKKQYNDEYNISVSSVTVFESTRINGKLTYVPLHVSQLKG